MHQLQPILFVKEIMMKRMWMVQAYLTMMRTMVVGVLDAMTYGPAERSMFEVG